MWYLLNPGKPIGCGDSERLFLADADHKAMLDRWALLIIYTAYRPESVFVAVAQSKIPKTSQTQWAGGPKITEFESRELAEADAVSRFGHQPDEVYAS